jgi:hypothetical protein
MAKSLRLSAWMNDAKNKNYNFRAVQKVLSVATGNGGETTRGKGNALIRVAVPKTSKIVPTADRMKFVQGGQVLEAKAGEKNATFFDYLIFDEQEFLDLLEATKTYIVNKGNSSSVKPTNKYKSAIELSKMSLKEVESYLEDIRKSIHIPSPRKEKPAPQEIPLEEITNDREEITKLLGKIEEAFTDGIPQNATGYIDKLNNYTLNQDEKDRLDELKAKMTND